MEFTARNNDLIYGALEVFLEHDSPILVARESDHTVSFSTILGQDGRIKPLENGDWEILLEGNSVYTIEKEIYELINYQENTPPVEDLLQILSEIYQHNLQDKSKILVETIIRGLAGLIIDQKISSNVDLQLGPYLITNNGKIGNIKIVLN
jgi:hypothetical protein